MTDIVIKTRIIPKKIHDSVVTRDRLLGLLEKNLSKNIILITSPAGFGKTTLVLDFFRHIQRNYAWLYIAPDINNFSSFVIYLVQSLKELNNEFGTKTLELLGSFLDSGVMADEENHSINALMGMFSNEIVNTFNDDVYIVIDDFHNTGNALWITRAFNNLIDDFPENLHFFITSRAMPEFNYPRMAAKRNFLKIESEELTFNDEEIRELLSEIYSIDCGTDEIKLLDTNTEGWITGLHMILQAYGRDFGRALAAGKIIEENIFLYFAEEIFKSLDIPVKDFLMATSLPDSFNEELCAALPGIDNHTGIINELKKKNIFLETSVSEEPGGGYKTIYSYHNLFKQFLVTKLHELKTGEEIENIAAYISSYYMDIKDIPGAIEFSIISKNYERTSELLAWHCENLFKEGMYNRLQKWIDLLPENYVQNNTTVKYYKGKLLRNSKTDTDKAENIFSEISLKEQKGTHYYILSRVELAEILVEKSRPDEAAESLKKLLAETKETELRIYVMLALVKAYYNLGISFYTETINVLNNALKTCEDNNLRSFHAQIYSSFGRFYLNSGEFSKALHYFRNVVQIDNNIYRKLQTTLDIVLLYSWSGEYVKAKEWLDDANSIFEKYPVNFFKRDLMRVTGLHALECGDFEYGIEKFIELNSFDTKNNIQTHTFWYYMLIGEACIFLNQKEKAKEYYQLAESAMNPRDEHQKLEHSLHLAVLKKNEKPDTQVERVLLSSLKHFDSLNLLYSKSQVEFYLADFYYKTGRPETSLKYMKDSLDIASEKGFYSFFIQDFISKRYLFDLAAVNNVQTGFIQNIYARLIELENFPWISAQSKKRWKKASLSLFDIKLNTFGGIEIFVRGNPVAEDKWVRKKSKLLLAYLLINMEHKHTKDKILNLFFGELSASSAENIFHQSITNMRSVLMPYSAAPDAQLSFKGKKTKYEKSTGVPVSGSFIIYEDKLLKIAPGYNYFVDVTEFINLTNRVKSSGMPEKEKELIARKAADLYKGEFMPGHYDEWIEELRMILQNRFIELCEDLIVIFKKLSKYEDILYYGEKLITEDKLHQEAFVNVIEAYTKTNNTGMAKKKFSQLLKNYNEEYGEKPGKEVLDRIEKILKI